MSKEGIGRIGEPDPFRIFKGHAIKTKGPGMTLGRLARFSMMEIRPA